MKFAILGAGAIGAYVGAALARGGSDVVLIARGPHLEAMQRDGVTVNSPRGDFHAHPEATDDFAALADADVVFIGLKAYSLPEVAPQLAQHLPADAAVIAGQNGIPWWYFQGDGSELDGSLVNCVDPGGVVSEAISPQQTVGCVIYCSTEITRPGVIRHTEGTRFAIGEPDGSLSDRCAAISEQFVAGGLKCPVEPNLREQLWLKLIGNVPVNAITALTGATLGQLGELDSMTDLLLASMGECAEVATRLGVTIPVSLDRRLQGAIDVGDHRSSMLQDLDAGKPLETACLSGAVIEIGDRLGMPLPYTRAIHACIEMRERIRDADGAGS